MTIAILAASAALLAAAGPQATPADGLPVAAFGGIYIDPAAGRERLGPMSAALENCSDAAFYCLKGERIRLVVPKRCSEWRAGAAWSRGGVTSRVAAGPPSRGGHLRPPHPVWYVGTEGRPQTLYVFSDQGLELVVDDPYGQRDFWRMAQAGTFQGWYEGEYLKTAGPRMHYAISSYDPVMRCRP